VVVRQTPLYIRNLLLAEADLACDFAGIADREDGHRMTFAPVAFGAAGAVADDALEQRAAEEMGGIGKARDKAVAFAGSR